MLALLDPSRQEIPEYVEEPRAIEAAAAAVKERFPRLRSTLRIADDFPESIAAYKQFDVLLVNAVCDGLNLVAKEAPLVNARDGVVVLSENAGAHRGARRLGGHGRPVRRRGPGGGARARRSRCRASERRARLGGDPGARARATTSRPGSTPSSPTSTAPSTMRAAHERALARRRVRRGAHGRRRRQADVAAPGGRARVGADGAARPRSACGELPKGDALATAQLAGIMAAKRTSDLIPLCHPLPLSLVDVSLEVATDGVEITATAETTAQTGVEMEALVAASVAALTVYDMAKAIDKEMVVTEVTLVEKTKVERMKAAVLTVSDGVVAGTREDGSGDLLDELLAADGYEVERQRRARRGRRDRRRDRRARRGRRARAHDGRHGRRAARRDARGDALGARSRGARDRRGDPRRLDREDAARAALARRRRRRSARTLVVNLPGSPGGCRDGYAVLRRRSRTRSALLAERRDGAHGRRERRPRSRCRAASRRS